MSKVTATDPTALATQYPHVDGVTDWRAQQSLRLLWERVFSLESRLQGVETTQGDLVSASNRQDDQLMAVSQKADDTLAKVQGVLDTGVDDGGGGREPTIPDYSSYVEAALARFNPVVAYADVDAAEAQLTRAAAWDIYQHDPAIGLCEKTTGTNVLGLSIDLLVQQTNGDYADIVSARDNKDGTKTIIAQWVPTAGKGDLVARWVQPTEALATAPGPMGPAVRRA